MNPVIKQHVDLKNIMRFFSKYIKQNFHLTSRDLETYSPNRVLIGRSHGCDIEISWMVPKEGAATKTPA